MTDPITTFSGAHAYRPQCVIDAARLIFDAILGTESPVLAARVAERVTFDIVEGRCPRCRDPLMPDVKPADWRPAGSRALPCRCLPVCETCASWVEPVIGVSPVTAWPTDTDADDGLSRKEFEQQLTARLREQATAAVLEHSRTGLVLLTEDGVVSVAERPRPGRPAGARLRRHRRRAGAEVMTRTPQDTFLSDQTLATARTAAADPSTIPVAVTAANGEQCTWCDCPDGPDSPHNQRGYRCPGCPATAKYVVSTFSGPNLRYDFPACDRHHTDILASIAKVVGGSR